VIARWGHSSDDSSTSARSSSAAFAIASDCRDRQQSGPPPVAFFLAAVQNTGRTRKTRTLSSAQEQYIFSLLQSPHSRQRHRSRGQCGVPVESANAGWIDGIQFEHDDVSASGCYSFRWISAAVRFVHFARTQSHPTR